MGSTFSAYLELGLLLAATVFVFERTRNIVIYGSSFHARAMLGGGIVVCLIFSAVAYKLFTTESRAEADRERTSFVVTPDLTTNILPEAKEHASKTYAQLTFVQSGEIVEYRGASGERYRFVPTQGDIQKRAEELSAFAKRSVEVSTQLLKSLVWGLAWMPVMLVAWMVARLERRRLIEQHGFRTVAKPKTFAEVEGFVGLLQVACEDAKVHNTLEVILSQPDEGRKAMIRKLLTELREKMAPQDLIDAFLCLMDDEVAEKVYVVIHKCERQPA